MILLGQCKKSVAKPTFLTIAYYLCCMRYDKIMQEVFPKVLVEYFTIVDMRSQEDKIEFWLDEKEFMEREDYKKGTVRSYGFTQSKTIQDFPLRGKPVFLHVRRRRWRDSATGEIFSYSYDDLTAEGSKLTSEFVAFLKEAD